jgi:hypothetical protein
MRDKDSNKVKRPSFHSFRCGWLSIGWWTNKLLKYQLIKYYLLLKPMCAMV